MPRRGTTASRPCRWCPASKRHQHQHHRQQPHHQQPHHQQPHHQQLRRHQRQPHQQHRRRHHHHHRHQPSPRGAMHTDDPASANKSDELLVAEPSNADTEAWPTRERERRTAWLRGPTEADKLAWARRRTGSPTVRGQWQRPCSVSTVLRARGAISRRGCCQPGTSKVDTQRSMKSCAPGSSGRTSTPRGRGSTAPWLRPMCCGPARKPTSLEAPSSPRARLARPSQLDTSTERRLRTCTPGAFWSSPRGQLRPPVARDPALGLPRLYTEYYLRTRRHRLRRT
jgi:hypothetical protein